MDLLCALDDSGRHHHYYKLEHIMWRWMVRFVYSLLP